MMNRKKQSANAESTSFTPDDDCSNNAAAKTKFPSPKSLSWSQILFRCGAVTCIALYIAARTLSPLAFLRTCVSLPVVLSLYAGLRRGRSLQQRIIPLTLVLAVVAAQLPAYVSTGLGATAVVLFSLATKPDPNGNNNDDAIKKKHQNKAGFATVIGATLVMIAALLTENFLIWVVSATFEAGQSVATAPPPLQDNGQRVVKYVLSLLSKQEVVGLRRMLNTQWALVSCLSASFLVVELFHPVRTLYSLCTRAVLTVAAARVIRTISFLLTVVPNSVLNCYAQRFPVPPPTDPWEWIWVGLLPRSNGGCNDLIISGHATITSALACTASSVADDPIFGIALWSMVVLDYAIEIYEGFHYSVDMWLGIVLVSLLWHTLKPLEGATKASPDSVNPAVQQQQPVSVRSVLMYLPPALVAYVQLIFLPQWTANFLIVIYASFAVFIIFKFVWKETQNAKKQVFMHYSQHVLLCLLLMAFGIYL